METKISVCFNHYRGEGGTAKEIATDYEVTAESEEVPSEDRRSFFRYITISGYESNVMSFLEECNLTDIVNEENEIEPEEGMDKSYYDSEGDDAML